MPNKIPLKGEYYYDEKRNIFVLKSKWTKRIKSIILACFVVYCVSETNLLANATYYQNIANFKSEYFSSKEAAMSVYVQKINPALPKIDALQIANSTVKWSKQFGIDSNLMLALTRVESGFDPHSISSVGALGLTQIMVQYHHKKIVEAREKLPTPEIFNIDTNIYLGTWVLKDCLNQFKSVPKALQCYNGSTQMPNGYEQKVLAAKQQIDSFTKRLI